MTLEEFDPELAECLRLEEERQRTNLEMIASESVQPPLALALAGSAFNNKTAVGNPGKQRLKGSQHAERLERLVAGRARDIFWADHAVVTTYPGVVASLHLQTIAAMGFALRRAQTEKFRALMRRVVSNAQVFCGALLERGFGVVTGGTDCDRNGQS